MGYWSKAAGELRKSVSEMEEEISGYSYKDPKHTEKTDFKFRKIIASEINKCRDLLFPLIEAAYIEQDMKKAGVFDEMMQWFDIFLLELGIGMKWSEVAEKKDYMRLIRLDVSMLKNTRRLTDVMKALNESVLEKKRTVNVSEKGRQIKKYIMDLLSLFKKRRLSLGG